MSLLQGKWLSADAKQKVLESKLIALHVGVLAKAAPAASSVVVTTEVEAAATTDVNVGTGAAIGALAAKGIFTGTVSGPTDLGKVVIRNAGTKDGIDDGTGQDVYGVLSWAASVYTLEFKKDAGTAHTMAGTESLDFFFIESFDLFEIGIDRFLTGGVNGVLDADTADDVLTHLGNGTGAHADTAIASTFSGTNYLDAATEVHAALIAADSQIKANADAIPAAPPVAKKEILTLVGGDITAGYKDLTGAAAGVSDISTVRVVPVGGLEQEYTVDFTVITDGSFIRRINWSGLGLDTVLVSGDKLQVFYEE